MLSVEEAALEIERVWLEQISYRYLERHEFRTEGDTMVFYFVTQIAPNGFFVTGRIELRGHRRRASSTASL